MDTNDPSIQQDETESNEPAANRRQVLQAVGGGAVFAMGLSQTTGTVAADDDAYETEELPPKEAGELRGEVMSSSAFKTVRQELQHRDFWPSFGEGAVAARVTNTETGEEWTVFKAKCEFNGDESGESNNTALLYTKRKVEN